MDSLASPNRTAPDLTQVLASERRRVWDAWVRSSFPGLAVKSMPTSPVRAHGVQLGAAQLWSFDVSAPLSLHGLVQKNGDGGFAVIQLEGSARFVGSDREWRMLPGQICLGRVIEARFDLEAEASSKHLILELPWSAIASRHPHLARGSFYAAERGEPAVELVRELSLATLAAAPRLDAFQKQMTLAALIQLFGLAGARDESPDEKAPAWRIQRACALIEGRLHDSALNATVVAAEQHISRRRLDELFVAATGAPVSARIAESRLQRAAELLRDVAQAQLSISEVAYRVGFTHASHFTRAFRQRWQLAPKAFRLVASSRP
jgi:AraC-like DNA-binding protein